eukprot:5260875-Prymnesium_polylepis.1
MPSPRWRRRAGRGARRPARRARAFASGAPPHPPPAAPPPASCRESSRRRAASRSPTANGRAGHWHLSHSGRGRKLYSARQATAAAAAVGACANAEHVRRTHR